MIRIVFGVAASLAIMSLVAGPVAAHGNGKDRSGNRDGFSAYLFELFDGNGDEALTMQEVKAGWAERFNEADADGDGLLSAEELSRTIEALRTERRARRIGSRIERHDADGDGMISLEEATAAVHPERIERLFERFDTDGDGSITKAEMDENGHRRGRWFWKGRNH